MLPYQITTNIQRWMLARHSTVSLINSASTCSLDKLSQDFVFMVGRTTRRYSREVMRRKDLENSEMET